MSRQALQKAPLRCRHRRRNSPSLRKPFPAKAKPARPAGSPAAKPADSLPTRRPVSLPASSLPWTMLPARTAWRIPPGHRTPISSLPWTKGRRSPPRPRPTKARWRPKTPRPTIPSSGGWPSQRPWSCWPPWRPAAGRPSTSATSTAPRRSCTGSSSSPSAPRPCCQAPTAPAACPSSPGLPTSSPLRSADHPSPCRWPASPAPASPCSGSGCSAGLGASAATPRWPQALSCSACRPSWHLPSSSALSRRPRA